MKRFRPLLLLLGALVALAVVLSGLFQLRLARDLYPPYSTLRADPLGLRAFHDALAALPGMKVERWVRPLERLPAAPPRTIILAGGTSDGTTLLDAATFNAFEAAVRGGSRLVVTFRAEFDDAILEREESARQQRRWREHPAVPEPKPAKPAKPRTGRKEPGPTRTERDPDAARAEPTAAPTVDLAGLWGFEMEHRELSDDDEEFSGARREPGAPPQLPATLQWKSDRYFKLNPGMGWRTLYRRADEHVLAELPLGRGSIVLASDSYFLSNEAVQRDRATPLLAWIVGPHAHVVFVETHLGVEEDTGVAALARRYGLAPAAGLGLLLAVLFVWRRAALFVPPAPEDPVVGLDYHPTAGLAALLRRALPLKQLVPAGLAEWRKTASRSDLARAAAAENAGEQHPVTAYNRLVAALRRR